MKNYDSFATGMVTDVALREDGRQSKVTVGYLANNTSYTVTENIKYRNEPYRVGKLEMGIKRMPVLGDLYVGKSVTVRYMSDDPSQAYIENNSTI